MANHRHLENSILVRKGDLVRLIIDDCGFDHKDKEKLILLLEAICSLIFMEFVEPLEAMKSAYYFFDPDSDHLVIKKTINNNPPDTSIDILESGFVKLIEHANFKKLTWENVHQWEQESSKSWGLNVQIQQEEFDRLLMYYRGDTYLLRRSSKWWKPWKKEKIPTPGFSRFAIFVKMKPRMKDDSSTFSNHVILKLFKDIAKNEIPMIFPGAKVRLNRIDQSMIGYPIITGLGLLLYNVIVGILKLGLSALMGITIWPLALAFGGYGYRSYYNYVTKRQNYDLRMTKTLYFQSLDSNSGVITRLLDEAEEQQSREALLGYYCLLKYAPDSGWTTTQLDDFIELFFNQHFEKKIDYDVVDCVKKLQSFGLVETSNERLKAVPVGEALTKLQSQWPQRLFGKNLFSRFLK